LRKDFNLLLKAYEIEAEKEARTGMPSALGYVDAVGLFFRYRQLAPEVSDEDWFEFSKWLRELRNNGFLKIRTAFLDVNTNSYRECLAKHLENVKCGLEKPSEKGFWAMLKRLCKLTEEKIQEKKKVEHNVLVKFHTLKAKNIFGCLYG